MNNPAREKIMQCFAIASECTAAEVEEASKRQFCRQNDTDKPN